MSGGTPGPARLGWASGYHAARPVGLGKKTKILRRCQVCGAAPGHRCQAARNYGDGAVAYIPLKNLHKAR